MQHDLLASMGLAVTAGIDLRHALAWELQPPRAERQTVEMEGPPLRQLLGRTDVGPASVVGASADGRLGIGVRLGGMRLLSYASSDPGVAIVGIRPVLAVPGASALSDIVIDDGLYCDGYE